MSDNADRTAAAGVGAAGAAAGAAPETPVSPPLPPPEPSQRTAPRTHRYRNAEDIESSVSSFSDLLLPQPVVQALAAAGFQRPSPVQQAAIPLGLVGSDLIVQAKSGTGKTCVFAVIALQRVQGEVASPQVLVLAPTRELALQSAAVITRIAGSLPAPAPICQAFVGGLPTTEDNKRLRRTCHIVVGTPGRVCALLASGALPVRHLRMLVLDEADALVGGGFYPDIAWAHGTLPAKKQVLAFSATYTPGLLADLEPLVMRPQSVLLCEEGVTLKGIKQFYSLVEGGPTDQGGEAGAAAAAAAGGAGAGAAPRHEDPSDAAAQLAAAAEGDAAAQRELLLKVDALLGLLAGLSFHQAVVFTNHKAAAEWLARRLTAAGFPAVALTADLPQPERSAAVGALRAFTARVLVATDVAARGVDLDRVNLVAQLGPAQDAATHVHRIGRTGRFGSRGVAVSFVTAAELARLQGFVAETLGGGLSPLPPSLPPDLYSYELATEWERAALDDLRAAPPTAQPDSPPPLRRVQQRQQQQEEEEGEQEHGQGEDWGTAEWQGSDGGGGPGEWTTVPPAGGPGSRDAAAWQAWEAWQAWQVWQAWQAHYAGGVQPHLAGSSAAGGHHQPSHHDHHKQQPRQQPATQQQLASQQQPAKPPEPAVWHRSRSSRSSSTGVDDGLWEADGGGSCGSGAGGGLSLPDAEDLDPHGRALLSSLVVALDSPRSCGGAEGADGAGPAPDPLSARPAEGPNGRPATAPQPPAHPAAAAPSCPHCWREGFTAWHRGYAAWCADYDTWRAGWGAPAPV